MLKKYPKLASQFLGLIDNQLRLEHFLKKVIIVPVIRIEVLSVNYFQDAPVTFACLRLTDTVDRVIIAKMSQAFIEREHLRNSFCQGPDVGSGETCEIAYGLVDGGHFVASQRGERSHPMPVPEVLNIPFPATLFFFDQIDMKGGQVPSVISSASLDHTSMVRIGYWCQ